MASCCETEESWNGRVRRISDVHKHTVTAGESKRSQGSQKKENWNQPDEDGPQTVTLKLTRRKKKDSIQVASCCETEESWNGHVRRISIVHNNNRDHRKEKNEIVLSNGLQTRYFAAYYSKI